MLDNRQDNGGLFSSNSKGPNQCRTILTPTLHVQAFVKSGDLPYLVHLKAMNLVGNSYIADWYPTVIIFASITVTCHLPDSKSEAVS